MNLDPVILGFLGRALSFEFSAVQQYLSLSKLMQVKGLTKEGEKFQHEAQEEMKHVQRIISRLIGFGCAPNATQLRPCTLKGSLMQVLKATSRLEKDIVLLYEQAVSYCEKQNDIENKMFFEGLLKEERSHYAEMETMISRISSGSYFEFD